MNGEMNGKESNNDKSKAKKRYARVIAITGASSGIGAGLAKHYAGMPNTFLALAARGKERLVKVAKDCQKLGADVHAVAVDISDRNAVASWLYGIDKQNEIDIVFANAGVDGRELAKRARKGENVYGDDVLHLVMNVNVIGTTNTIGPALELMLERHRGQIAIVSSGTALMQYGMEMTGKSLPGAIPYLASKEAQSALGIGLHYAYKAEGVDVRTIYPGYVESDITKENEFDMLRVMPAKDAAAEIARQMAAPPSKRGRIVFPFSSSIGLCCINSCISLCGGIYCIDACFEQKGLAFDPTDGSEQEREPWAPSPTTMNPPTVFTMGEAVTQSVTTPV